MMDNAVVLAIGAVSLVALLSIWSKRKSTRLPLPPGPRPLPILGNALDINIKEPLITYMKWWHQFGDIVYCRLLGQDYIIVNSEKVARSLSDTSRSAVYADRPMLAILELLGMETSTAVLGYGDAWRVHRKLFHQTMGPEALIKYRPFHTNIAVSLVQKLLQLKDEPDHLGTILQSCSASTVLSFTYGHVIKSSDHPLVKLVESLTTVLSKDVTHEKAAIVQTFPFVKYLPSWIPGLGFMERVAVGKQLSKAVWERPFADTKNAVAAGTAPQSMVADFLMSQQDDPEKDHELYQELEATMKAVAATVYIGGADSTASTIHTFILAMILFPEVQEKARAEIDSVVGKDRLPTFDDRGSLPYIEAVMHETLRWNPAIPIGVPHATTADDVYEGYHIPKGSVVIFNGWAISRSYPNPDQFDPERYLLPTGELLPTVRMAGSAFFGFGRRVCPGRFFAENVVWSAIVHTLATLRFSPAKDENGLPMEMRPKFRHGNTSQPVPFRLTVTEMERASLVKI